jgi:hypothetical protein
MAGCRLTTPAAIQRSGSAIIGSVAFSIPARLVFSAYARLTATMSAPVSVARPVFHFPPVATAWTTE